MFFKFEVIDDIAILVKYSGQDDHVVVPKSYKGHPVKIIGEAAFAHSHISSVSLPKSVHTIRRHAFIGSSLEWVGFGSERESLENGFLLLRLRSARAHSTEPSFEM